MTEDPVTLPERVRHAQMERDEQALHAKRIKDLTEKYTTEKLAEKDGKPLDSAEAKEVHDRAKKIVGPLPKMEPFEEVFFFPGKDDVLAAKDWAKRLGPDFLKSSHPVAVAIRLCKDRTAVPAAVLATLRKFDGELS